MFSSALTHAIIHWMLVLHTEPVPEGLAVIAGATSLEVPSPVDP